MSEFNLTSIPQEVLLALSVALSQFGSVHMTVKLVGGAPAFKVIGLEEMHCATCQCERAFADKPVADNKMSKSWHR